MYNISDEPDMFNMWLIFALTIGIVMAAASVAFSFFWVPCRQSTPKPWHWVLVRVQRRHIWHRRRVTPSPPPVPCVSRGPATPSGDPFASAHGSCVLFEFLVMALLLVTASSMMTSSSSSSSSSSSTTSTAGQDPLKPYRVAGEFMIAAALIVTREVRGVHLAKVQELKDLIQTAWISSSFITVQLMASGKYVIVDGMHRLSAVLSLIMDKILPSNYEVPCTVYRPDTPADLLLRFSCSVNLDNQATSIMTFIDKMRWVACYMMAIVVEYVRDNSKIKPGEKFHWKDITAEHVRSSMQGPGGKEVQNFSLGVCQRTIGLIHSLWVD